MMKKLKLLSVLALVFAIQACSKDSDEPAVSELEKNYFSIENAVYNSGAFPEATVSESIEGVDMSDQVMNGAMNYITVITPQTIQKFFVGIKGVPGYWEYTPDAAQISGRASDEEYMTYVIPIMMSLSYTGNATILLSGELPGGDITPTTENDIFYIETMPGAIEVKLSFSNSKDIDLHLYTPEGEHIFYGHRGGEYHDEQTGNTLSYGLDIDSNAGCNIDNVNKENIYIPQELVTDGTYTVVVDMYMNCREEISTNWSITAWYENQLIIPDSGSNPASGRYPAGAGNGDMTQVMTFTIDNTLPLGRGCGIKDLWIFKPKGVSEIDQMKLDYLD